MAVGLEEWSSIGWCLEDLLVQYKAQEVEQFRGRGETFGIEKGGFGGQFERIQDIHPA